MIWKCFAVFYFNLGGSQMWKIWPILALKFDSLILKTHLTFAFFVPFLWCIVPFYASAIPLSDHFVTEQQHLGGIGDSSSLMKIPFLSFGIVQNLSVYHTLSCLFVWSSPTAKCVLKGDERQEGGVCMCGWLTAHWILLSQKPGQLLVWASMSRGGGFCPTKTISTEGFCPEELIMGHRQLRHKAPPPHALPLEQCIYGVSTHWEKSDKNGTPRR